MLIRFVRGLFLLHFVLPQAPGQPRDPLPMPDVPGYRTLKADLHTHTIFSDGDVWPPLRVWEAWRDGLDVLALTDHSDRSDANPRKRDIREDLARPYAVARPVAEQLGIILIPGVEVGEGAIHCNILFLSDPNELRKLTLLDALRRAHAQKAFAFWNHPGWKRPTEWSPLIGQAYDESLIQGIELVNGSTFYPETLGWAVERNLTMLANSDIHGLTRGRRDRPVTLIFASTADLAGVREALFSRRTAAWLGSEIWGGETFLLGLWNGAVKVENPELRYRKGDRSPMLRLFNRSAVPFHLRVRDAPAWLRVGGGELPAESTVGVMLGVSNDTPVGIQHVQLEVEIRNLHVGPSCNLTVQLPLTLRIE
jgi:predicted metal-dependent phosphoesterase TrpH